MEIQVGGIIIILILSRLVAVLNVSHFSLLVGVDLGLYLRESSLGWIDLKRDLNHSLALKQADRLARRQKSGFSLTTEREHTQQVNSCYLMNWISLSAKA